MSRSTDGELRLVAVVAIRLFLNEVRDWNEVVGFPALLACEAEPSLEVIKD